MRIDESEKDRIRAFLAAGNTIADTAKEFKRCKDTVREIKNGYSKRQVPRKGEYSRVEYTPTPDDIAKSCEEIRSGWTDSDHYRRWVDKREIVSADNTTSALMYNMERVGRKGRAFFTQG